MDEITVRVGFLLAVGAVRHRIVMHPARAGEFKPWDVMVFMDGVVNGSALDVAIARTTFPLTVLLIVMRLLTFLSQ